MNRERPDTMMTGGRGESEGGVPTGWVLLLLSLQLRSSSPAVSVSSCSCLCGEQRIISELSRYADGN